ncbi:MAG: hypothetical protein KDC38_01980 [Planctomycetes bacterium]|nr:hypothetical protein [Planctomycetota bacterium]
MDARPRPRFERFTTIEPELLRERLKCAIQQSGGQLVGEVLANHAQIMIAGDRRHTWSPCMTLTYVSIEDESGSRLRIRGLFGPHPALWTLVATLYGFAAFVTFVGIMVGWSQWLLDWTPSGFLAVPAGLLIAVVLYLVSLSGQALAHDEMHELSRLVETAIEPMA